MTFRTTWGDDAEACGRQAYGRDDSHRPLPQRLMGGAALAAIAFACAWTLCANLGGERANALAVTEGDEQAAEVQIAAPRSNPAPAYFDARFYLGPDTGRVRMAEQEAAPDLWRPGPPIDEAVLPAPPARYVLQSAPSTREQSPRLRRKETARMRESGASHAELADAGEWKPEQPTVFEKLFGHKPPAIFERLFGRSPSHAELAYAAPQSGVAGDGTNLTAGLYDRQTAVYDIASHTVYLPDGTTLEAHSGYGSMLDNPRTAAAKDRGVTPPDIYDLRPRERVFHGVHALRLIPEDEKKVHGRQGLLAHTYMLGPSGQSNGCVSFKDYETFLRAYENHQITRLAVVAHL